MSPRILSILVAIVSLVWASLFAWTEIIDADPNQYSIKSARVKQEFANCSGTFAQRQECAERITEAQQQLGFLVWCKKVAVVLGPPLALWGLMGVYTRQLSRAPAEPLPPPRRTAADAAVRTGPRRVRAAEGLRPDAYRDPHQPPPDLDPSPGPHPGPHPQPGPHPHPPDAPGQSPIFTGGRREPVRRRDR